MHKGNQKMFGTAANINLDPYEHWYSPELAIKIYKELSAKYPENPHRTRSDFATASKVAKSLKRESDYVKAKVFKDTL